MNGNRALEEHVKAQNREHMKTYRRKLKSKKDAKGNTESEKELESHKRQKAVLKTQKWRMKIKLAESKNNASTCTTRDDNNNDSTESKNDSATENSNDDVTSPSRWALYRAKKKVLKNFPETPDKKAAIIESVIDSPRTANILFEKGVCISGESKKKLELAFAI
jgi:hypothetical protein